MYRYVPALYICLAQTRTGFDSVLNSSQSRARARAGVWLEIQRFGVTPELEKQFKMYLVKSMITSCIAFNYADNEYLGKALAVLGMAPLTRT